MSLHDDFEAQQRSDQKHKAIVEQRGVIELSPLAVMTRRVLWRLYVLAVIPFNTEPIQTKEMLTECWRKMPC